MPSVLKSMTIRPSVPTAMRPPSPPSAVEYLVQRLAHRLLEAQGPVLDRGAHVMRGHRAAWKYSPCPVAETAHTPFLA